MILLDTGPLVALFDPQDPYHAHCRRIFQSLDKPLLTTAPVLTEAFHLLSPDSQGSQALRTFLEQRGALVWFFDTASFTLALRLMAQYQDCPMDFADASLVAAAHQLKITDVFTVDRKDFYVYRVNIGHESNAFTVIGA